MGIDLRIGKQDHFTRYRIYKPNTNIHDKISLSNNLVGILHAKDISAYGTNSERFGGFMANNTRATIETLDKVKIEPNYMLYAIAEKSWYFVESVAEESHNESQQFSSRPIITRTLVIRK